MRHRLLVSVRGPKEALAAARGGAQIADVEYPASALGTPYPLNITSVVTALRRQGFTKIAVSTNIGETQQDRAGACQSALGVATAGAGIIKFGIALLPLAAGIYQGTSIVRTVRHFYPKVKLIPSVFADVDLRRFFDPLVDGPPLAREIRADGLLVDTFSKSVGRGLLDYYSLDDLADWVAALHRLRKEAWVAGSITREELSSLSRINVDVVCVRAAACEPRIGAERFGAVTEKRVRELVVTFGHRGP